MKVSSCFASDRSALPVKTPASSKSKSSYLRYPATNESLSAIEAAMHPGPCDKVLSIGGSGDQPFMFLSSGAEVVAVDNCSLQVDYIKKRKRYLESGNYSLFMRPPGYSEEFARVESQFSLDLRDGFLSRERFDRMRLNSDRLHISEPKNILEHAYEHRGEYSQIYLSNCIEHIINSQHDVKTSDERLDFELICLKVFGLSLKPGGTLYVSRGTLSLYENLGLFFNEGPSEHLVKLDCMRTNAARALEDGAFAGIAFYPLVFNRP